MADTKRRIRRYRTLMPCAHCGADFLRATNTGYCSDICRLAAKVAQDGDCWIWQAVLDHGGYGRFMYKGRRVGAHRASFELHRCEIPEGLQLDHLCRTPACVNPWHLEPVTARVNVVRGESPTAILVRASRCKRGHEFNAVNTALTREGKRRCRPCQAAYQRERNARLSTVTS